MLNEDVPAEAYKYAWSAKSEMPLKDFLTKFKPSLVQNDGTKPWIFVHGTGESKDSGVDEAATEAKELLKEVTAKVEEIKSDDSIPVRSNKKTGAKSKKEVREKVQEEATEKLKAIAQKHGYVSGKWLIFAPADKVDLVWSNIATSLVSGPLQATAAYQAKVATSPPNDTPNYQHLICIYLPDVYDKDSVTEVMKVLLRNHGVNLSGVKADLYTQIGIDSKHPSGIPSTVWKNTAILPDAEIKALKDAFFAEVSAKKPEAAEDGEGVKSGEAPADGEVIGAPAEPLRKPKAKPKLKKKANDPFGSDDEDDKKDEEPSKKPPVQKKVAKRTQDASDDDDEEDRPKKKRAGNK